MKKNTTVGKKEKVKTAVMISLIVLLLPILIANLTLIIKGSLRPDLPPDLFGIAPMAVTSGSMSGAYADSFEQGALIFIKLLDEQQISDLQAGEIITFTSSGSYVTHRIVSVNRDEENRAVTFVTQGDANLSTDGAIPAENVIGKCIGSVGGLGGFAMFMQTPAGILVIVGIPVLLYIVYDVLRIIVHNKRIKAGNGRDMREYDPVNDQDGLLPKAESSAHDLGAESAPGEENKNG